MPMEVGLSVAEDSSVVHERRGGRRIFLVSALFACGWFLVLLTTRGEQLYWPAYVEHAGWWTEASYLADHSFDYARLAKEPHGSVGGARNYFSTALPSLLALAMQRWNPSITVPAVHLLVFAFASGAGGMVVGLTYRWVGPFLAVLCGVVFGTIPIMYVQTELPSMDVFMLGLLIPSFLLLDRDRLLEAVICSIPAFLVKNSAFLFPAAVGGYSAISIVLSLWKKEIPRKPDAVVLFVSIGIVGLEYAFTVWAGNTESRVRFFFDVLLWLASTPELALILLVGLFATIYAFWKGRIENREKATPTVRRGIVCTWRENPFFFVGWILVGALHAAILATAFEARYLILALPWFVYFVVRCCGFYRWGRLATGALLAAWMSFNLLNLDGRFLLPLAAPAARGWGIPERSLEYRQDQRSNIELCKLLENESGYKHLLVCDQFVFFLQLPRLGYVRSPVAGVPVPYFFVAEDRNVEELLEKSPEEIVVAYVPSQLGELGFPAFRISAPGPEDEILAKDGLIPENVVYVRRVPAGEKWSQRCRAMVDLLFSQAKELDAAGRLAVIGYEGAARRLLAEEVGREPGDAEVTRELIVRLRRMSDRAGRRLTDQASLASLPRLLAVIERRVGELERGESLRPLTGVERGLDEFIPQRFRYMPRIGVGSPDG
jgi:hypothetical protein